MTLPAGTTPTQVYDELQAQSIAGLAPGSLAALVEPSVSAAWHARDLRRRALIGHLLDVQDEALAALHAADIPAAILKGAAAGMYYPDPGARSYGDVDVLVHSADLDRAFDELVGAGFAPLDEHGQSDHHVNLGKAGVGVELHWRPNGIPHAACSVQSARPARLQQPARPARLQQSARPARPASQSPLERAFEDALDRAEQHGILGHTFPALPTVANGASLLLHARRHLVDNGMGFRQVIDWMLFVRSNLTDRDWPAFQAFLGDAHLERTAACLTRFCQIYLGLPERDHRWCLDVEPAVCADLLEHICLLGNFGRKLTVKTGADALGSAKSPAAFLRYLQAAGLSNWTAAQRHVILRPLCWLYQALRYARKSLERPNAVQAARFDLAETARRRHLARELGLYD